MKYNSLIYINENFQNSVNIEFDLFNEEKVKEYIPTSDVCDVLKAYLKSVLFHEKSKATALIGPYGKGKSFLVLILLFLVSSDSQSQTYVELLNKIKDVDLELYNYILEWRKSKKKLLPVVINENYDDISQSFLLALNDALKRVGLKDLIPNTIFTVCICIIDNWEKDVKLKKYIEEECTKKLNISLFTLKTELEKYSREAYLKFENLYNFVVQGLKFNPMVSNNVVKFYSELAHQIKDYGFSGIFIVFDEFSKFLESTSENVMADLKVIQDFAELADRSHQDEQIHFCCITHKSINLYSPSNSSNSFRAVEGRFKELRFNRSLEENYEIISSIINKTATGRDFAEQFISKNIHFYNELRDRFSFYNENLAYKCFPLNPLATYCLVNNSEQIAQNERTLFTFLSDNDKYSLNSFLSTESDGLYNVDKLYDYFSALIKNDDNEYVKNIWFKCENSLNKCEQNIEKRIIKCISIFSLVNNQDILPISEQNISLGLFYNFEKTKQIINCLIDKHIIKRNFLNNYLSFAPSNDKQIKAEIDKIKNNKLKSLDYVNVLNKMYSGEYYLPRRYNAENKITRFYKCIYADFDSFMKLTDFAIYFNENYCDGIVIKLIVDPKNINVAKKHIQEIGDIRVVVIFPTIEIPKYLTNELISYFAMIELENQVKNQDNFPEISLLKEEEKTDIDFMMTSLFDYKSSFFSPFFNTKKFNELLSVIMEKYYSIKIVINNELINKKNVSSQYQKSINRVIDFILDSRNELPSSETSPETTIFNSLILKRDKDELPLVIEKIKEFIKKSEEKRLCVNILVKTLLEKPYGLRMGVIPLIFAIAISELPDNIILYYQNKQIDLNSSNIVKFVYTDDEKYEIYLSKGTLIKNDYVTKLLTYFNIQSDTSFRINEKKLFDRLKNYFSEMPNIVRTCTTSCNLLELSSSFINVKDELLKFNINRYDTLFDKIPTLYNLNFIETSNELINDMSCVHNNISIYKETLLKRTIKLFDKKVTKNGSIKSAVDYWMELSKNKLAFIILDNSNKRILDCLINEVSYNDMQSLNSLAKAVTGLFIEDWDFEFEEKYILGLTGLIKRIIDYSPEENLEFSNIKNDISYTKFSPIGLIMKNSIENVLNEYGESINNEEKVKVLMSLIKKIL